LSSRHDGQAIDDLPDYCVYVNTEDFNEYLEVVERVNIAIMEIVQCSGASFDMEFNPEFTHGDADDNDC